MEKKRAVKRQRKPSNDKIHEDVKTEMVSKVAEMSNKKAQKRHRKSSNDKTNGEVKKQKLEVPKDVVEEDAEGELLPSMKHFFAKSLRESHRIFFTNNGEEALLKLVKKYADKEFKEINEEDNESKKQYVALRNISCLFFVLQALASDEDETLFYGNVAETFDAMIEQKEIDINDIFAGILEMVARKGKLNRLAGLYLTTVFARTFKQEEMIKLAEIIKKSDLSIVTGEEDDEEDDHEFAPITAKELALLEQNRDGKEDASKDLEEAEDEDSSDGEDSEDEEGSADDAEKSNQEHALPENREPNPKMVAALNQALGRYAATEDDDEEDVDMDDEELSAMDQRLSSVMKYFTAKGRKALIQEAKHFRLVVAEILGLIFELAPIKEVLAFFPQFFEIIQLVDGTGNQEVISSIVSATDALSSRTRTQENVSKSALKLYKQLCGITTKMHNHLMKAAITHLVIFLFKNIKDDAIRKSGIKFIVQAIEKYFTEGNRSSKYTALYEVVKRYPLLFVDSVELFFDIFKRVKESKKGEAANFVVALHRKDLFASHKKLFTLLANEIIDHFKPNTERIKNDVVSFAMKVFLTETANIRL